MDDVENIKSKVDIVEVVSSYIPLKKAGRNFSGLCPFHAEKTPSFMVSVERQAFKCFGCGEGGDVFTFLEKMEGWGFREVLEELAKRVGIKLKRFEPTGQSRVREKILEINKLTAKFYAHLLTKHEAGEVARQYLAKRSIKRPIWEKFELGFAPDSWDKTIGFLKSRGFSIDDLSVAGLAIAGRKGFYDRFRNRLMFPLKDSRGTVLGFAGRLIEEGSSVQGLGSSSQAPLRPAMRGSEGQAKYINSPETPVFNKGSVLFGLDVAREEIRKKNETVLVEGEFDVLSSHAAGVLNVVASKGTALTDKQVAAISRICESVALCFDKDVAGDVASRRGIELLDMAGVGIKVVDLATYKDPDEFAKSDPLGFKKAIGASENIYDYLIESALRRHDASSAYGKKAVGGEILPVLSKISDDMVRAHYIGKLAKVLDLEVSLIADALSKRSNVVVENDNLESVFSKKFDLSLEEYFLALVIYAEKVPKKIIEFLAREDFANEHCRALFDFMRSAIISTSKRRGKTHNAPSISQIVSKAPKSLEEFVNNLYLVNLSPTFSDNEIWAGELVKIAERIKRQSLKRQLVKVSFKIKKAEREKDEKVLKKLTFEFGQISRQVKEVFKW